MEDLGCLGLEGESHQFWTPSRGWGGAGWPGLVGLWPFQRCFRGSTLGQGRAGRVLPVPGDAPCMRWRCSGASHPRRKAVCPLDWGRQSVLQGGSGKTSSMVVWSSSLSSCPHRVDRASTLPSLAGRAGSVHSAPHCEPRCSCVGDPCVYDGAPGHCVLVRAALNWLGVGVSEGPPVHLGQPMPA